MSGASNGPREPVGVMPWAEARTLLRRGLRLEYATLAWNVVGIIVTLIAAVTARSVALAGFSLDSAVEMFASLVVVGQLAGSATAASQRRAERRIGLRPPDAARHRATP